MSKLSDNLHKLFRPGTVLATFTYALIGVVIAVLFMAIGFWKTLMILVFAAIGALIGAFGNRKDEIAKEIKDKAAAIKVSTKKADSAVVAVEETAETEEAADTEVEEEAEPEVEEVVEETEEAASEDAAKENN